MTLIQFFLNQLQKEAAVTRKMLELVPQDKYTWKPHPKSMTLIHLATHVAEIPGWIEMAITKDELDFGGGKYQPEPIENAQQLLSYFDNNLSKGISSLENGKEEDLDKIWTMRNGEQVWIRDSKAEVVRMSMSQLIHHRAQLGVFLRLLDIPIPGPYGPSADEMEMMPAAAAQ